MNVKKSELFHQGFGGNSLYQSLIFWGSRCIQYCRDGIRIYEMSVRELKVYYLLKNPSYPLSEGKIFTTA